jgi:polyhydroxyalkanoate synthesis regulator protein
MHNPESSSILIKRYGPERLYDVDLERDVVVDELYAWQLMAVSFIVRDATSGEDVTAAVLAEPTNPVPFADARRLHGL